MYCAHLYSIWCIVRDLGALTWLIFDMENGAEAQESYKCVHYAQAICRFVCGRVVNHENLQIHTDGRNWLNVGHFYDNIPLLHALLLLDQMDKLLLLLKLDILQLLWLSGYPDLLDLRWLSWHATRNAHTTEILAFVSRVSPRLDVCRTRLQVNPHKHTRARECKHSTVRIDW